MNKHWQIRRTRIVMGEMPVARTDHPAAYEPFSQALNVFKGIHAVPDATRDRERLAAL